MNQAVNSKIKALITKLNNPNVNKLIGKNNKLKIGLIKISKIVKITEATSATVQLPKKNCAGKRPEKAINKIKLSKIRLKNFIISS